MADLTTIRLRSRVHRSLAQEIEVGVFHPKRRLPSGAYTFGRKLSDRRMKPADTSLRISCHP